MSQAVSRPPQDVEQQWRLLHDEAQIRYQELAPPQTRDQELAPPRTSTRLLLAVAIIVGLLVVVGGGVGYKRYVLDPYATTQVAENAASAVAEAATVVKQAEVQATQNAVTATAQAKNRNATATAQAKNNNATATASVVNATETAIEANRIATASAEQEIAAEAAQLAARAAQIAEDPRCLDVSGYGVEVNTEKPTLKPQPGTPYVIGDPEPRVIAHWNVSNQGACAWVDVELHSFFTGERIKPELSLNGEPIKVVEKGQAVDLTMVFPVESVKSIDDKWLFTLNKFDFPDGEKQFLRLNLNPWMIPIEPAPTE